MLAVGADAEHAGAEGAEFPQRAIELDQLGGAHEGEVEGPEEDRAPAAVELVRIDRAELGSRVGGDAGLQREIREPRAQAEQAWHGGGHGRKLHADLGAINSRIVTVRVASSIVLLGIPLPLLAKEVQLIPWKLMPATSPCCTT